MDQNLSQAYQRCAPLVTDLLAELRRGRRVRALKRRLWRTRETMFVLLTPWYNCPVAYFSMIMSAALHRRHPIDICFVIDDLSYPDEDPVHAAEANAIITMATHSLKGFRVIRLGQLAASEKTEDIHFSTQVAEEAVKHDLAHRLGNRIIAYPPPTNFTAEGVRRLIDKGRRILAFWRSELEQGAQKFSVFIPGGVANGTWVYTRIAKTLGIRCVSFDSGEATLYLSMDGIAAQQTDNSKTFRVLSEAPSEEREAAVSLAREVRLKRERYGDSIMKVAFNKDEISAFDVLLCMSCEGDTAALGLDYLFENAEDWIVSTVKYLNEVSPGIKIAIRQHPDERFLQTHQSTAALSHLADLRRRGFNFVVFDAHSDVSTYELSRNAKAVVVGATTFGLEAVMLGLPTVVFRRGYYADAGFVVQPRDREDYFRRLLECLDGKHAPGNQAVLDAHLMYYIVEACNRIRMGMSPQPGDLLNWLENSPSILFESSEFQRTLRTIAGEAPYALLKHRDDWKNRAALNQIS